MNRRILPLIGSIGTFWLLFSLPSNSFLPAAIAKAEQPSTPLSNHDLYQIARSVTIRIISDGSSASGTLIKKQGQTYTVLTSSHVLLAGTSFRIQMPDGKTYPCSVAHSAAKEGTDLALLQFHSDRDYAVASLGLTSKLFLNQPVVAAGFAQNIETLTFTTGQISLLPTQALKNGYRIGYTSTIQQGMSGGPIFNKSGEVIGVSSLSAHPLLNTAYIFEDGSLPSQEQIAEMRRASWGIPIQTVVRLPEVKLNSLSTSSDVATLDKVKSVERVNSVTSSRTDLSAVNLVAQSPDGSPSERYVKQGQNQADSGNLKGAVESYTQAINLDSKNANAYSWRGRAYSDLQEYDKGLKDLTRAIELTPDSEYSAKALQYMFRGITQFSKRDYAKAVEDYTRAIEFGNDLRNPNKGTCESIFLSLRGRSRFELKDYTGSVKDITQAFGDQYYKHTLEDYFYRGNAYNAIGDNQKAVKDWRKVTQLSFVGQVENTAKEITVQIGIRGSDSSRTKPKGSGVIIANQGKTYYVLTCNHVVPDEENYVVTTADGKRMF